MYFKPEVGGSSESLSGVMGTSGPSTGQKGHVLNFSPYSPVIRCEIFWKKLGYLSLVVGLFLKWIIFLIT